MEEVTRVADEGLLLVGINRPARKNALTSAMYVELAEALAAAERDDSIRAVVVHGTESAFCAGNDIGDFANPRSIEGERPSVRFMKSVIGLGKPLLAAVNGPAVGIGATMLLHCDLVFAGTTAKLAFPFSKLGLCPEFASSLVLPVTLGYQRAAELLLLGDAVDAAAAQSLGLVNAVLPPEEVLQHAVAVGRRLCAASAPSLRAIKSLMRGDSETYLRRMDRENEEFARLLETPHAKEAFKTFLMPRPSTVSSSQTHA
ncbi:enoyl-CoA hydratase-related protein [Variovorax saccharolyticus]|uniref:enoyl-CoA hydratase-related protein n=1 Tax=Variovorax saccharolyticus TaxID=3053516 RepID=UPI00257583C5|nr:enoyl-CoA hydratase-related protein [Variovorax sp. J22R187]MDM0021233.1 enoyl-CoA hydratase-related protein [Variovorax sp. J22R187]